MYVLWMYATNLWPGILAFVESRQSSCKCGSVDYLDRE